MPALHDMEIKKLKCKAVTTDSLDMKPSCELAFEAAQRDIVEVDHPEVRGRIQPVEVLPVYANLSDDFIAVGATGKCGDLEALNAVVLQEEIQRLLVALEYTISLDHLIKHLWRPVNFDCGVRKEFEGLRVPPLRKELVPLDHEVADLIVARIDGQRAHDIQVLRAWSGGLSRLPCRLTFNHSQHCRLSWRTAVGWTMESITCLSSDRVIRRERVQGVDWEEVTRFGWQQ